MVSTEEDCFTPFQTSIAEYTLPERFTFPFYYDPHPLSLLAAKELQEHIENQTEWKHDFWEAEKEGDWVIGKMFGVLVVRNKENQIGYLSAFSGKLANSNHHRKFVPPVYDLLSEDGFFLKGMAELDAMTLEINKLEEAPEYLASITHLEKEKETSIDQLEEKKAAVKAAKKERKIRREKEKKLLTEEAAQVLEKELVRESIEGSYQLKKLTKYWKERIAKSQEKLDFFKAKIDALKKKRKNGSAALQNKIFDQYKFLNQAGEVKTLADIFQQYIPISGSGECAAPKLLQYAFQHQMKPISMAEFWWGQSPNSEIRTHRNFYPSCIGKCKPILGHMLEGIEMDENPMLKNPAIGKELTIEYEDEHLLVVNKPTEFLSVPGRNIRDSVAERMKQKYPEATGPMIVHRLDMSTSGLILIAKDLEIYKYLQHQFIHRTIKKRYVAVLDGILEETEGVINLPLIPDWNNRPRQMVCYENGKPAQTKYKAISHNNQQTRIYFYPITGRSHQLRVHAAHPKGLNLPIVGDDLYGTKKDRLYLHAEWIEFQHPATKERMSVEAKAEF